MGKQSTCYAGDSGDNGLILGLGRCPGEGKGDPLQYSWKIPWTESLEDTVLRVVKSDTAGATATRTLQQLVEYMLASFWQPLAFQLFCFHHQHNYDSQIILHKTPRYHKIPHLIIKRCNNYYIIRLKCISRTMGSTFCFT